MQVTNEMVAEACFVYQQQGNMRAAIEAALGVCKELPAAEVIERVAKDQVSDPSTDDLSVPLALENVALASRIALRDACIEDLAAALGEIVKFDRAEKRTCVDFDPAGCTYEVEDIDGPHASRARATLEKWGLK